MSSDTFLTEPIEEFKKAMLLLLNELQGKKLEMADHIRFKIEETKTLYQESNRRKKKEEDIEDLVEGIKNTVTELFKNQLYLEFITIIMHRIRYAMYTILENTGTLNDEVMVALKEYQKEQQAHDNVILAPEKDIEEISKIFQENKRLQESLEKLAEINLKHETELKDFNYLVDDLRSTITQLESQLESAFNDNDELLFKIQDNKDIIKKLEETNKDLNEDKTSLQEELRSLKEIMKKKTEDMISENKQLKERLKQKTVEFNKEQENLFRELTSLQEELDLIEKENQKIDINEVLQTLQDEILKLQQKIGEYQQKSSLSSSEQSELDTFLEKYKLSIESLYRFTSLFDEITSSVEHEKLLSILSQDGKYIKFNEKLGAKLRFQDIVSSFLKEEIELEEYALDYILQLCFETTSNYPVFFFISKSQLSVDQVIEKIEKVRSPFPRSKKLLLKRLREKKVNFQMGKLSTKTKQGQRRLFYYNKLSNGEVPTYQGIQAKNDIPYFLEAVSHLNKEQIIKIKKPLFALLLEFFENDYLRNPSFPKGKYRNAINNLDAQLYMLS